MRRLATILTLAVALALPASTFAASSSGTTTESFSIASTISLTVPASITYAGSAADEAADVALTAASDNPSGMSVKVDVNVNGAGKIVDSTRSISSITVTGATAGIGTSSWPEGYIVAGTPAQIISSTNAEPGFSATVPFHVDASGYVPGSYTGSLSFVASTNP